MTTHEITTGKWYKATGTLLDTGYAGHGVGLNNPNAVNLVGIGPLPPGIYRATEMFLHHPHVGQYAIHLEPDADTRAKIIALGRGPDSFFIHGDDIDHVGQHLGSDGCLVHSRTSRVEFWEGTDHIIRVVNGPSTDADILNVAARLDQSGKAISYPRSL